MKGERGKNINIMCVCVCVGGGGSFCVVRAA